MVDNPPKIFDAKITKGVIIGFTIVALIMFTIVIGSLISQNATDLCDPMLSESGVQALTGSFFIMFAIIAIFAVLYGYSGAMPYQADQAGLSQSMSYFKLKSMASITETFI